MWVATSTEAVEKQKHRSWFDEKSNQPANERRPLTHRAIYQAEMTTCGGSTWLEFMPHCGPIHQGI